MRYCNGGYRAAGRHEYTPGVAQILRHVSAARFNFVRPEVFGPGVREKGRYYWGAGKAGGPISPEDYESSDATRVQRDRSQGCDYWLYERKIYVTSDLDLTPEDVAALVNESANRRRLQLEKAHALQAMNAELSDGPKRAHIPQDVKVLVWQRDGGRYTSCAAQSDLEFDHIIPVAMGGSNTARNLQLLCEPCNRRKGASLG